MCQVSIGIDESWGEFKGLVHKIAKAHPIEFADQVKIDTKKSPSRSDTPCGVSVVLDESGGRFF